ncbi:MAG: type IX secretion system membrane protein PorP/SprF [Cyclobacteriaceae bacterium]
MTRKFITVLILSLISFWVGAQQRAMFTQYMFNGLALNPAYAGSHESISATALSRTQWVGVDGAPTTHTLSVHTPVPGKNIAIGAVFSSDNIGVSRESSFVFSYAYNIRVQGGKLSMGLQGGIRNTRVNFGDLSIVDPNLESTTSGILPNFGLGLYYYTQRFYAGLSVPTALKNSWNTGTSTASFDEITTVDVPHYFFTTGYVFDVSPLMKFKPSILVKSVGGAPLEIDMNASLILDEKVWIGLSYRSLDALSIFLNLQISQALSVGYAFDYTLSSLRQVSSGSHEIMLNYRFVYSRSKIVTPRYF